MSNFLTAYAIQGWLEICPQGYLEATAYGHQPDEQEPELVARELAAEAAAAQGVELESTEWHGTELADATTEDLEAVLADTVLGEFKTRLGRIGLEYQSPSIPA